MIRYVYRRGLYYARHRYAPAILMIVSFLESFILPLPPAILLVPMSFARPRKAMRYAMLATIASVLGAMIGYALGLWGMNFLTPYINNWGYAAQLQQTIGWVEVWGIWVLFAVGFSPLPYKLVAIAAGALGVNFVEFVAISLVARALHFIIFSWMVRYGGHSVRKYFFNRYIKRNTKI